LERREYPGVEGMVQKNMEKKENNQFPGGGKMPT